MATIHHSDGVIYSHEIFEDGTENWVELRPGKGTSFDVYYYEKQPNDPERSRIWVDRGVDYINAFDILYAVC